MIALLTVLLFNYQCGSSWLLDDGIAFVNATQYGGPMPSYAVSSDFATGDEAGQSRKRITILTSITYGGNLFPAGNLCPASIQMALDRLRHSSSNWLPYYELAFELVDDECLDDQTIFKVAQKLRNNEDAYERFPVLLGPTCATVGQLGVASLAKYFNFLNVLILPNSVEIAKNRKRYNTTMPLGVDQLSYMTMVADFAAAIGWRKIGVISELQDYYDANDILLVPVLEERNISIIVLEKIGVLSTDENEFSKVIDSLRQHDIRVILLTVDYAIVTACWLHRRGIFGPNYAIIINRISGSFDDERSKIPFELQDWCTRDMLNEVSESFFFYGDAYREEITLNGLADSTGFSHADSLAELQRKIIGPENMITFHELCYDETLFTGILLNSTETLLNARNQTLSDWVTGSDNFVNDGQSILEIMKEALLLTKVIGLKGEYYLDSKTLANSFGYVPLTITQAQRLSEDIRALNHSLVAVYQTNKKIPLSIIPNSIKWKTIDGRPIHDSVRVIEVQLPLIPLSAFAILTGLSVMGMSLAMVWMCVLFYFKAKNKKMHSPNDFFIIVGNILLFIEPLTLPYSSGVVPTSNCYAATVLAFVGLSVTLFATLIKLDQGRRIVALRYDPVFRKSPMRLRAAQNHYSHEIRQELWPWLANFVWICIVSMFLAVLFVRHPFETAVIHLQPSHSPINTEMVFVPTIKSCDFVPNNTAIVPLSVFGAVLICFLIRGMVLANYINMVKRHPSHYGDYKRTGQGLFCIASLLVAGNVQFATLASTEYRFCVVSSYSLFTAAVSLVTANYYKAKSVLRLLKSKVQAGKHLH